MKPQNWLQDHALTDEEWALVRAHREGGREGVLRALGMEQADACQHRRTGEVYRGGGHRDDFHPLFAFRFPVPEPSEGATT